MLLSQNREATGKTKSKKAPPVLPETEDWSIVGRNIVLLDSDIDENGCKGVDDTSHGSIVDHEVQQFVFSNNRMDLFLQKIPHPDPCTLVLLNEVQSQGWKLKASQFCIFDEYIGIATAIDLLAETSDGKLVLLEQKVTKHRRCGYYEKPIQSFQAPLSGVPFSLFNIDLSQLLTMCLMLHYSYGITVDEAYLVRVGQGQMWIYRLSEWCRTRGDALYQALRVRARVKHVLAKNKCRRRKRQKRIK